jgi:hypothetical protein
MRRALLAVALTAAIGAGAALAQTEKPATHGAMSHGATKGGDAAIIASAMKAAPPAVARNATIVDMGPNGMRVVRKGTGAFTCMADNPATPGPDPMCLDKNAMAWAQAYFAHKPPPKAAGFMYMLEGGTDASNTDPFAKAPTKTNNWIKTGPHVMIVGDPEIVQHYPASPTPDTTQPYVMWPGTQYAHLMIPVH